MRKKSENITNKLYPISLILIIIIIWALSSSFEIIPRFMLPSPLDVLRALIKDFDLLLFHSVTTLTEAFLGLFIGILLGLGIGLLMDFSPIIHKAVYPILIISQTIPTVAIAPLLVLWFGYDLLPKVILIVIVTFFPITIGLLDGFASVDEDSIKLLKSMNANKLQILYYLKFPASLPHFFSGLKISASYSIVGAVISEWLGGFNGLGVYMTRVKKSFAFDKMFAVIFLISFISLLLMAFIKYLQKKVMPWDNDNKE